MTTSSSDISANDPTKKNVLVLSVCLGMAMTGSSIVITISALVGITLAPDPAFATIPFGLQWVMTVFSTVPLSLLMRRLGRRPIFVFGQLVGCCGAAIAAFAIFNENFYYFAVGSAIMGIHNACWQYYRFAAADTASEAFKSRAISYVMAGGVFAAIAGPELASRTHGLFEPVLFAGGYFIICCITVITSIFLLAIDIPKPRVSKLRGGRPLAIIIRQPVFIVAVLSSMLGYGLMNLSMTATPLAMKVCGFVVQDTKWIIQAHILGMYLPSFLTGSLIKRFGIYNILIFGAVLMILAASIAISGITIIHFAAALTLLGLGWNFLFIGGTTLLTESYEPAEKEKVQGCNDLLVFGTVVLTAFLSGTIQYLIGWTAVNASLILPALLIVIAVFWLRQKQT